MRFDKAYEIISLPLQEANLPLNGADFMKERIIQSVFFFLFVLCLLTGILSFTHEHDRFDSVSLLIGALSNFAAWLVLYRQQKGNPGALVRFATDRRMGVFYLITFGLFLLLTIISFMLTPEILTPATLFLCAMTQLLGYRIFIRQQRRTVRKDFSK